MHFDRIIWDLDDDPDGNVQHILQRHGITQEQFELIVASAKRLERSRISGNMTLTGRLPDGRLIRVIFQLVDQDTIYPITAFEPGHFD
jgi:hypothetical protein